MKIARWIRDGIREDGVVDSNHVFPFANAVTVADLLAVGLDAALDFGARAVSGGAGTPLDHVQLVSPLAPTSIRDFAVFEQHVEGMVRGTSGDVRATVPEAFYEEPVFYFTNPHSIVSDREPVTAPAETRQLDFELELAAIIGAAPGRVGRNIAPAEATEHVFGYTIMNDWSARDLQAREMRMRLGPCKGKDFGTSLGPWIVTRDEFDAHTDADGVVNARGTVRVNGIMVGEDSFANMAWTFGSLVAFASRNSLVVPGDVLGSGTVGHGCLAELWGRGGGRTPPALDEGDVVVLTIEGIGTLSNVVTRGGPTPAIPSGFRGRRVPSSPTSTSGGSRPSGNDATGADW